MPPAEIGQDQGFLAVFEFNHVVSTRREPSIEVSGHFALTASPSPRLAGKVVATIPLAGFRPPCNDSVRGCPPCMVIPQDRRRSGRSLSSQTNLPRPRPWRGKWLWARDSVPTTENRRSPFYPSKCFWRSPGPFQYQSYMVCVFMSSLFFTDVG